MKTSFESPWNIGTDYCTDLDPTVLAAFLRRLENEGMALDSLLIHTQGKLQFEHYAWPYRRDLPHMLHSATKSFVGTATGFALAEGHLDLQQHVVDFFPEHKAGAPDLLSQMTVADLLTMRTGHDTGPSGATWRRLKTSWIEEFFRIPVTHAPGTRFTYSSGTSHVLSAVIQKATGTPVSTYLTPRLFQPLGFQNYSWSKDPEGFDSGGNGLSVRSMDFLKWGVLHINNGRWEGEQVLPPQWTDQVSYPHIADATALWNGTAFVSAPSTASGPRIREGYGYQTWCGPEGSYFASGMFGQMCLVLPKYQTVIATTAGIGSGRSNRLLEEIVTHLLPALEQNGRADPAGRELLWAEAQRAAGVPQLRSAQQAPVPHASYFCSDNADSIQEISFLRTTSGGMTLLDVRFTDERGEHSILCGLEDWHETHTTATGWQLHHSYQPDVMRVVAGATWVSPSELVLEWYFNETPFHDTVTVRWLENGDVKWKRSTNANSGATSRPTVTGRRNY